MHKRNNKNSVKKLPTYKEYTIDFRLREIRKVNYETLTIEFISFRSKEGWRLLKEYEKSLNSNP